MPEKTRDRKNWFPRFKSNWLGTYRSKQMFVCCECAVTDAESARYKGAEGKHCVCGNDQWHLAKSVEEAEYNRRMEISKSFGGLRYEEAVESIKNLGGSEFAPEYTDDKRVRCESDESSASTASVSSTNSSEYHVNKRIKLEPASLSPASRGAFTHELQLSMGSNVYSYDQHMNQYSAAHMKSSPTYASSHANSNYTPLSVDMLASSTYDQLATPPFTDEESFGELLQGILEDDPRSVMHAKMAGTCARQAPYPYAHMKRYPGDSVLTSMPEHQSEFDFYQNSNGMALHSHSYQEQHQHQHQQQQPLHHGYSGYHEPHAFHLHQAHMVPPVACASFPSAV